MRRVTSLVLELSAVAGILLAVWWAAHTVVLPVRVDGSSMEPTLTPGDIVLVALGHRPIAGDIALIRAAGHEQVLHRVVELEDWGVVRTKGDANTIPDFQAVPANEVAGRCIGVIPVGALVSRWRVQARYATMAFQPNNTRR